MYVFIYVYICIYIYIYICIGGLGESQMRLVPCMSSGVGVSGGVLPGLAKLVLLLVIPLPTSPLC